MRTSLLLAVSLISIALAGAFDLSRDTLDIPVGRYRWIGFTVDIAQQEDTRIEGTIRVLPDSASVELLLMHRDDFARWTSGGPDVDTLYHIRTGGGEILIPIEGFGDMALVISNRGNYSGATVAASLDLAFEGSGVPYSPLLTGGRIVLAMLAGAVALTLVLGILVREAGRRRRKRIRSGRIDGSGIAT